MFYNMFSNSINMFSNNLLNNAMNNNQFKGREVIL